MGFLDLTDAELIALTRQRRREAREQRIVALAQPIRFSAQAPTPEFVPTCSIATGGRRREPAKVWRMAQWHAGNRDCTYCGVLTIPALRRNPPGPTTCTVDHKEPLALGGDDAAHNWAICCSRCNNWKGSMTEAEFRSLIAEDARLTA
jgi:5-methylcytosine-specific restriction endonuclease McrA